MLGKKRANSTVLTSWKTMKTGHMNFFRPAGEWAVGESGRDRVSELFGIPFRFQQEESNIPLKKKKRPLTAVDDERPAGESARGLPSLWEVVTSLV